METLTDMRASWGGRSAASLGEFGGVSGGSHPSPSACTAAILRCSVSVEQAYCKDVDNAAPYRRALRGTDETGASFLRIFPGRGARAGAGASAHARRSGSAPRVQQP